MGVFLDGPLAGQPADAAGLAQADGMGMLDLAALGAGGSPSAAPGAPGEEDLGESERLNRVMSDMLILAGGGSLTEQSKASIQQAMSLVQRILATEEKEQQDAAVGKASPRMIAQAYGQGAGGAQA